MLTCFIDDYTGFFLAIVLGLGITFELPIVIFFLALFVPLVILVTAQRWYKDVCTRNDPPATIEKQETYRYYFLGSIACSALVFGLSLWAWWALNITYDHQYKLEVDGLQAEQAIDADGYYSQDA